MASLFDAFTGAPGVAAADASRNYLLGSQNNLINANGIASNQISDLIRSGYAGARGDLGRGYDAGTGAISGGANSALGYLDTGANSAIGTLQSNGGAYAPLSALADQYGKGAGLYADALGINGAEGTARAQGAFTAAPGYQYQLDQGIDAINRRANAAGMLAGGNADRDAIAYASNLANQGYNNWLSNLSGYNGLQLNATQGAAAGNAGINNTIAGIQSGLGQSKAGVASNEGSSLANLAQQYYGNAAGLSTGENTALGQNIANWQTLGNNMVQNFAPQVTKTYSDAANAEMAGSANFWNLGLAGAKAAAGAAGGSNWLTSLLGGGGTGSALGGAGGSVRF